MAETASYADMTAKNGEVKATVFAEGGKRYTAEQFEAMYDQYKKGSPTPGFIILPPGKMRDIRAGFETVAEPVREQAPKIGTAVGTVMSMSPLAMLLEKAGIAPEGTAAQIGSGGATVGKMAGQVAALPFKSPEAFGSSAAQAAVAVGTGATSLPMQMGRAALAGGLGHLTGSAATGGGFTADLGPAAIEAAIAGLTQGAFGAFKAILGRGASQQAQEGVAGKIADIIRERHPDLVNVTNAPNIVMSNKATLAEMTQYGLRVLRGDVSDAGETLIDGIAAAMHGRLPRGSQNTIRADINSLVGHGIQMIENVNNTKAANAAVRQMNEAARSVVQHIDAVDGVSAEVRQALYGEVQQLIEGFQQALSQRRVAATLFRALEESGAGSSFNAGAFQRAVRAYHQQDPTSSLATAGGIAGRGANIADTVDAPMIGPFQLPRWLGGAKFPEGVGQRYVGRVQPPQQDILDVMTVLGGEGVIRDFASGRR